MTGTCGAVTDVIGGVILIALGVFVIVISRVEVLWTHLLAPLGKFFYLTIARAQVSAELRRGESLDDAATRLMVEARQWDVSLGMLFVVVGAVLMIVHLM